MYILYPLCFIYEYLGYDFVIDSICNNGDIRTVVFYGPMLTATLLLSICLYLTHCYPLYIDHLYFGQSGSPLPPYTYSWWYCKLGCPAAIFPSNCHIDSVYWLPPCGLFGCWSSQLTIPSGTFCISMKGFNGYCYCLVWVVWCL